MKYVAKSMADIVAHFEEMAAREKNHIKSAKPMAVKVFTARANTWLSAAEFLRNCEFANEAK